MPRQGLLLYGTKDGEGRPRQLFRTLERIKDHCRLQLIDGADHSFSCSEPRSRSQLEELLSQLYKPRASRERYSGRA